MDEPEWPELPDDDMGALERRTAIFHAVYEDGQSFARHYDEKLRTLITALSFLTVAGVTLFIFSNPHRDAADLTFDGRSWNAGNVFFIFFLTAIALSLASAAAGMDASAHRPSFFGGDSENRESILFYERVADRKDWGELLQTPDLLDLQAKLAISYARDAHALARRARHKVARTAWAQMYLELGMIALILLGIARLPQSSATTRAELILSALVVFSWLPYGTFCLLRAYDFPIIADIQLWPRDGRHAPAFVEGEVTSSASGSIDEAADKDSARAAQRASQRSQRSERGRRIKGRNSILFFYFLPPLAITAYAANARWFRGSYWDAVIVALAWIVASRLATSAPSLSPRRRSLGARPRWWSSPPVVAFACTIVATLALVVDGLPRHMPNILAAGHYAVNASGRVLICVRLAGPADSTPYISLNGGPLSTEARQFPVTLDDAGIGYKTIAVPRIGTYRVTVRRYSTDVDTAAFVAVPRPHSLTFTGKRVCG